MAVKQIETLSEGFVSSFLESPLQFILLGIDLVFFFVRHHLDFLFVIFQ